MSTALRFAAALVLSYLVAWMLPTSGARDGWAMFPPVCAIAVAIMTGRLELGLASALLGAGFLVLPEGGSVILAPFQAIRMAAVEFVYTPLSESFQLYIIAFTVSLIGMVRVVSVAGGTRGIADRLARSAEGARTARGATFLLGLAIFFDDYANTLVVGTTMRPVCDRFRISREKLAYLVDSTAAPVAGLAVVSTWIGYEVGLFQDAMNEINLGISGYELFFRALPSRFYCILALVFVAASVLMGRDFGPMLRAERRAQSTGEVLRPSSTPMTGGDDESLRPPEGINCDWRIAALPVAIVIFGVLGGMQLDSWSVPDVAAARAASVVSQQYWSLVFSSADGARVMFLAAIAGSVAAFALALTRRTPEGALAVSTRRAAKAWLGGVTGFHRALIILVLAWAIKEACKAVGTSDYLIATLGQTMPASLLPVVVFLLGAAVAFAIGTSWATMAILLPTTVPLAFTLGGLPIAVLVAAAVLDGAIFGDHCSPISDTTVLSSVAASCDHLDHVKTQVPYAVVAMMAAAVPGYIGTAYAYPAWVGLLLGVLTVCGVLWLAGDDPDVEPIASKAT
ncbi:MAG: Na+/H+ antiporter NhaC family protein [Candidatus Latescibacterota bacterium]|nr:Na+/H+ antiporter NhaC family protein [Candidatus Latescibacterota bacterium]